MTGSIKKRMFNKHYNKLVGARNRSDHRSSINTFSSATILATAKCHTREMLLKTPQYFKKMGIPCDIYVVKQKGDAIDVDPNIHLIDIQECTWYGVPSQEILIDWLANKTDLLIVSDPDDLPVVKYLCAASNSKLKTAVTDQPKQQEIEIDFWVETKEIENVSLVEQCKMIYKTLSLIGVQPPVIGS